MDLPHPMTPPPATDQWLDGHLVHLRAPEPEDLDTLYAWENDAALWEQSATLAPYSRYALREYIAAASTADLYTNRQLRLMIDCKATGRTVGIIDLYDFDPLHLHAGLGILIDAGHRRRGFGREAIHLIAAYAFGFLHLHLLYAHVAVHNAASLRLFAAAGFRRCGILPDWLRTPRGFADAALLARLNP